MEKKIQVRIELGILDKEMTKEQALRYGNKNMPKDLKQAGFQTVIFTGTIEINGSEFYRINYGKP